MFAAAAPKPEAVTPERGKSSDGEPSSVPPRDEEGLRRLQQVYGERMAAMAVVEVIPWQERIQKHVRKIIIASVAFVFLVFGLSLGFTTYGIFGRFLILGPPHAGGSARQFIQNARTGLRLGTYGGVRRAVTEVGKAHAANSIAVDAAGLMAQAAWALRREAADEGTAELGAARVAIGVALDYGPRDPDVVRGEAALALLDNQPPAARLLLEELVKKQPKEAENFYLLGAAAAASTVPADRAQARVFYKQALAADPKLGKAELALAELSRQAGALADALTEAEKAVELEPEQVHAKLMVRQLEAATGKTLAAPVLEELRGLSAEKSGLSKSQRAAALALVAGAQFHAGHVPEAQKTLKEALDIDARNREGLMVQNVESCSRCIMAPRLSEC